MILKTIASLQTMTRRAIRGFLFACVLGAGGDVEANELTEITQFHARCAVPGSDMETIHDEMKAPVFLERMLKLVGHPGNWGAFHWIVGGGKDSYSIAVRQFDANADPGKLLEYLRRYVECRRLGLSKEFVLQRLVAPVPFVPPKGPAAAAVSAAREFLPGISEQDIKPLTHYPGSFPEGSASWIDVKSGLCYVMRDSVISRIFTLTKDRQQADPLGPALLQQNTTSSLNHFFDN
jgi:hypothetical protein